MGAGVWEELIIHGSRGVGGVDYSWEQGCGRS